MSKITKVLGIDPGTGRMGWAIVTGTSIKQQLMAYGCIETPAHTDQLARLKLIHHKLCELIAQHQPTEAAVEDIFFAKNAKTVIRVAEARGVILSALINHSVPAASYTPLQVKSTVTGFGKADKRQVQSMVKSILKLKAVPRPDDAADAVAVALTHLFTNSALV